MDEFKRITKEMLKTKLEMDQLRDAIVFYLEVQKNLGLPDNVVEAIKKIEEIIVILKEWKDKLQKSEEVIAVG